MKKIIASAAFLLYISHSLFSQNVSLEDEGYQSLKDIAKRYIQSVYSQKGKTQKTAYFSESYYTLGFDTNFQQWDTLSQTSIYADSTVQNLWIQLRNDNWTPQGYVPRDSLITYSDNTNKYFKAFANFFLVDSSFSFRYDSSSSNWSPLVEEWLTPNSNGDLSLRKINIDTGLFFTGIPTGTTLYDSTIFNYNQNNDLISVMNHQLLSGGIVLFDSTLCTVNSNGNRILDSTYILPGPGGTFNFFSKFLYDYDSLNRRTRTTRDSSIRVSYRWGSGNTLLSDTNYSFRFNGTRFEYAPTSHRTYDRDSTVSYRYSNGVPVVNQVSYNFYNSNNQLDSVVRMRNIGSGTNLSLIFTTKDIYEYPLIVGVSESKTAKDDYAIFPNPVKRYALCKEYRKKYPTTAF